MARCSRRHHRFIVAAGLFVAALVLIALGLGEALGGPATAADATTLTAVRADAASGPPSTAVFQPPVPDTTTTTAAPGASGSLPATPTLLRIPDIGVQTEMVKLGLNLDKTIEVPEDFDLAGWYRHRATPGDPGPAVILGHVDSYQGPAVFFELRELALGDRIEVERSDGRVAIFEVESVEQFGKDEFPTERVYGWSEAPSLRLVTCGGNFDRERRGYDDNLIVFARFTGFADDTS